MKVQTVRIGLPHRCVWHASRHVVSLRTYNLKSNHCSYRGVNSDVELSASTIDDMVREIGNELLVDAAASFVLDSTAAPEELAAIVRNAVGPRIQNLNTTFLPVLNSYIEEMQSRDKLEPQERDVLSVLAAIKGEVLVQLSQHLPPPMRALQAALEVTESEVRMDKLRMWMKGDGVPQIDIQQLETAICRMLDDLETAAASIGSERENVDEIQEAAPNRRLLAKLCLLREEVRQLTDESLVGPNKKEDQVGAYQSSKSEAGAGFGGRSSYIKLGGVPEREAAFVKNLLGVDSPQRRMALLDSALRGEPTMGAPVRPGALLDCITALQLELMRINGENENIAVRQRLEDIFRAVVRVLDQMARED